MDVRLGRVTAIAALVLLLSLVTVVCSRLLASRGPHADLALNPPQTRFPEPRSNPVPAAGTARRAADDVVAAALRSEIPAQSRMCSEGRAQGEMTGSYRDAAYWCAIAAGAGDAPSEAVYARLFQIGAGVAQDDAQAALWYEKAIEQQNAYAMYMRGRMLTSSGDAADQPMGLALLQRAAALGDSNARWTLQSLGEAPETPRERPLLK